MDSLWFVVACLSCFVVATSLADNKNPAACYLFFSATGGFANQFIALKKSSHLASLSNCTLILPPLLDHHLYAFGGGASCKFGHDRFKAANSRFLKLLPNFNRTNSASMYDFFDLHGNLKQSETIQYVDLPLVFPQCTLQPREFPLLHVECDTPLEKILSMIVPTVSHMPCPIINNLPATLYLNNISSAQNMIANISPGSMKFVKAVHSTLKTSNKLQVQCIFLRCYDHKRRLDSSQIQTHREFISQVIVPSIRDNISFFLMSRCQQGDLHDVFVDTPFHYNYTDTTCDNMRHPLLRGECIPPHIKSAKNTNSKSVNSFLELFDDLSLCASSETIYNLNSEAVAINGTKKHVSVQHANATATGRVGSSLGALVLEVASALHSYQSPSDDTFMVQ